ncbi:MAG: hypothetical protein R3C16_13580 [Hyphomonadaceae bacterium]
MVSSTPNCSRRKSKTATRLLFRVQVGRRRRVLAPLWGQAIAKNIWKDVTSPGSRSAALVVTALGFAAASTTAAFALPAIEQRTSANYDTLVPSALGVRGSQAATTSALVFDLKRVSGLTWDELAGALGVSRRTLHFWANGGAINARNEQRLRRAAQVVENSALENARLTRELLMQPLGDGLLIDLLRNERFDEFRLGGALALAAMDRVATGAFAREDAPILAKLGTLEDRPIEESKYIRVGRRPKGTK